MLLMHVLILFLIKWFINVLLHSYGDKKVRKVKEAKIERYFGRRVEAPEFQHFYLEINWTRLWHVLTFSKMQMCLIIWPLTQQHVNGYTILASIPKMVKYTRHVWKFQKEKVKSGSSRNLYFSLGLTRECSWTENSTLVKSVTTG